ncbi:MAG: GNAT family N-acetyltransferase [Phycisphaeraceae bacterium]|nr:GNAT family N-acetyltransferase [Phycisphaeraceae bacterium]
MQVRVRAAAGDEDIAAFRVLCAEYVHSVAYTTDCASLEHQRIDDELANLPGQFGPPRGAMFLALAGAIPVGCVALRPLRDTICEMKRMYVVRSARGRGVGRRLAEAVLEAARARGYAAIRLDTGASMKVAASLYESLGFRDIPAYNRDPTPGTRWMELQLQPIRRFMSGTTF